MKDEDVLFDISPEELVKLMKINSKYRTTLNRNFDYALANKWVKPESHRSGLFGRISKKIISKIYFLNKLFLRDIIVTQDDLNNVLVDDLYDLRNKYVRFYERMALPMKREDEAFDYHKFQSECGEDEEYFLDKYKMYLDYFNNANNALVIGCGRGEFLKLLKERNIKVRGVDNFKGFVDYNVKNGFDVEESGYLEYLESLSDGDLDAVACLNILEQFDLSYLSRLIRLIHKKLKKESFAVFEILNPGDVTNFYSKFSLSLLNKTVINPEVLKFMLREAGFSNFDEKYLEDKNELEGVKSFPYYSVIVRK